MQIVTKSYFSKENQLTIPLATTIPTAKGTAPSNQNYIDLLCVRLEKDLLLNALGVSSYLQFQLALNGDINTVINAKWKSLLEGEDYDGKSWIGLKHEMSLIAQKVYETYLRESNTFLTQSGTVQTNSENATLVSPTYKIVNANESFIKQYQGSFSNYPDIYSNFIDWYGNQEGVEVCLYQYLVDKKDIFTDWKSSSFKFYETVNSFGL